MQSKKEQAEQTEILTVHQVADLLQVSACTIKRWVREDKDFPPGATLGARRDMRSKRWFRSDILEYIGRRQRQDAERLANLRAEAEKALAGRQKK